jgi:hypothetical protein
MRPEVELLEDEADLAPHFPQYPARHRAPVARGVIDIAD